MELRIGWLYGHEMNIYGDRGNVISLARRAEWRGIAAQIVTVGIGERFEADAHDILFWGGGQDREQIAVAADLDGPKGHALATAIRDDMPILAICGGYQLLGQYYRPFDQPELPGIGALDIWSEAGKTRFIGNVVVETPDLGTLVGFENHSARTYLGQGVQPLGTVRVGNGNNGSDRNEGARYRNAVGSYMHGSLLPKNPRLADWLIDAALTRRYGSATLSALDDALENRAHATVEERALALAR
jgi:CobQ-like glutamine amidotransferase family enzyme